jgi:hypothetical protein
MRKLHDLVEFRNYLIDQLDHLSLDESIQGKIESIEKTKRIFPLQQDDFCNITINDFLLIKQQSQEVIDNIVNKISMLDLEIDSVAASLFDNDEYRNNFNEDRTQGPEFKNSLIVSAELEGILVSKITEYSDWQYPALQINPRSKKWIDPMVAGDPLYLTHCNINLVKEIIKPYPDLYQNRLRLYEIVDRDFSKLPQAQFSFVLCWDNFNYLSSEYVEKYIREVYRLLRPGGHFMFSYTNGDLTGSALRAESWACAYASARWIKKLCTEIGYEVIDLKDFDTDDAFNTHVSLAILKKPGILNTVKAAQAMAEIKYK